MDKKVATKIEEVDMLKLENVQLKINSLTQVQRSIFTEYEITPAQIKPDGTIVRTPVVQPQNHKPRQKKNK